MTELTATVVIESLLRATADDSTPIIRRLARNQARVFLDSRAGDAGEVAQVIRWIDEAIERARKHGNTEGIWLFASQWQTVRDALSATPAPAVDAVPAGEVACPTCGDTSPLEECATCGAYPTRKAALSHGEGRK